MSDLKTPLAGAIGGGSTRITDAGLVGMIALRGDLADAGFAGAIKRNSGLTIPDARQVAGAGGAKAARLLWMSPDELLLTLPYDEARAAREAISSTLSGAHFLAEIISDARASIDIDGPRVREILARLSPADVSGRGFAIGQLQRSRLGQAAAAFWLEGETRARVICFSSYARYIFDLLDNAARSADAAPAPISFA